MTAPMAGWSLTSRGTLVIRGIEAAADAIHVTRTGEKIRFVANSTFGFVAGESFSASRVKRVLVETYGGNDRVHIDPRLERRVTVSGGPGDDRIDGNPGATLLGGGGNDRLYVVPRAGIYFPATEPPYPIYDAPGLMVGGTGDDMMIGGSLDTVVGGQGDDSAILRLVDPDTLDLPADPPAFARAEGDDRATGIETFELIKSKRAYAHDLIR